MPNPERQLILYGAGTLARRRAEAERAEWLVSRVDLPRLAAVLRARRLLTTLGPRIAEVATGDAGDGFREAVDEAVATGRRHGAFLQLVSHRVIAVLAEAGIRSIALKGPLLGEEIYGDPGRRPSNDIDLLVSPEQLHAAADVVRELGYGVPTDYLYDSGLPLLHLVLQHERGELPPVELHWRVHWYERNFACERLLPPEGRALGAWRPPLVAELAALLLFYARDGFVDLRLASDLGAWWDVHGGDLPPGALDGLLSDYPEFARVIPVAVRVADKLVGLPGARIVGKTSKFGLRGHTAVRLANPNPRSSRAQIYADVGLIDGLLMPPGEFGAFMRRNMLPPPEVLNQHARHAARGRARSSFGRCVGLVGRYGLTMTRLLRPSETRR
jgi:hypothetical protein